MTDALAFMGKPCLQTCLKLVPLCVVVLIECEARSSDENMVWVLRVAIGYGMSVIDLKNLEMRILFVVFVGFGAFGPRLV